LLLDERTGEPVEETTDRRTLARADLVLCGVLALIGVVYAVQLIDIPATSPNQADIGPRAYPRLILVLLALITVMLLVKTLRELISSARTGGNSDPAPRTDPRAMLRRLGALTLSVVVAVVYLELMIPLGFIVATTLFVAVQVAMIGGLRRYRSRRVLIPIVFGFLSAVVVYVLFADSLGVLLPRGIFSL
jgi:hypothetical protein